jgi:methylated-DNA-[protein]-cysteine S-methyltransferase
MIDIEQQLREAALDLPTESPPVAERAAEEGLLDVAYTSVDSPLGPLVVAATPQGLVRVSYSEFRGEDEVPEELARRVSPRVLEAPARLDPVRRELDEYFDGRRQEFDIPIDWSHLAGFTREVLRATAAIRFGEVSTYAGVAEAAGSPRAVRAAGNALGANPTPIVVPCHRIVRTGGALGGYTGGLERKLFLLTLEGALPR